MSGKWTNKWLLFFGCVKRKLIVDQATKVVISRKGSFLHPQWNRFFKEVS
jgi:signal peptidase I